MPVFLLAQVRLRSSANAETCAIWGRDWHELEFKEFLRELKKHKVILKLSDQSEWMDFFHKERQKALALQAEIEKTDKEIDRMGIRCTG